MVFSRLTTLHGGVEQRELDRGRRTEKRAPKTRPDAARKRLVDVPLPSFLRIRRPHVCDLYRRENTDPSTDRSHLW